MQTDAQRYANMRRKQDAEKHQAALTRIYDILAGINDAVEVGDDGYARFGSVNDRDRLRELVQELEPAALAHHGAQTNGSASAPAPQTQRGEG